MRILRELASRFRSDWPDQADIYWRNAEAPRAPQLATAAERQHFAEQLRDPSAPRLRRDALYLVGAEPPGFEQVGAKGNYPEGRCTPGWEYVELWVMEADLDRLLSTPAMKRKHRSEEWTKRKNEFVQIVREAHDRKEVSSRAEAEVLLDNFVSDFVEPPGASARRQVLRELQEALRLD